MDLITAALVQAVARLAEPAVNDAYQAIKSLVAKKFGSNTKVAGALEGLEEDPETWSKPLDSALNNAGAANDAELKQLVTTLEAVLRSGAGRVGQSHSGVGDIVMGDKAGRDINKNTSTINTGGGNYVGGNVTNNNEPKEPKRD